MTAGALGFLLAGLLLVALIIGPVLTGLAHRLDRLHLRTEAAWAALDAALARRAVVARAVAATGTAPEGLAANADRAEGAPRVEREAEENALTRALTTVDRAVLPPAVVAELADAEHRVVLARRVHNDVVRDTVALRRRRAVRWLRLAGTAKQPAYFEIAEPEIDAVGRATEQVAGRATVRRSARVLLLDGDDRVLLFHGHVLGDPADQFWFTPGGGVDDGENLLAAAVRELAEETGLTVAPEELLGPVWLRRAAFDFGDGRTTTEEWFYVRRVPEPSVDTSGFTQLELDTVDRHAWWSAAELASTSDNVFPEQLAEHLPDICAGWDGVLRTVR